MEEYSIRPIEEKDLAMVLNWRNSERVRIWVKLTFR